MLVQPPKQKTLGEDLRQAAGVRTGQRRQGALRPCVPHPAPRDQPRLRPRALPRPTAIASSGSTRPPSRWKPTRWTACSALPYQRVPHPAYGKEKIPAYEMIKTSVNIMRGCFGGCSFCSITEHEGASSRAARKSRSSKRSKRSATRCRALPASSRISAAPPPTCTSCAARAPKPSRPVPRLLRLADHMPAHGHRPYPDHRSLSQGAGCEGIKKILIASGVRYDIAVEDPRYIKELAKYHVGGYLKIAPEHTEEARSPR